jgi:hypothetical protein
MYRQADPQTPLSGEQLRLAMRKHVNMYQLQKVERLTGGQDHWDWFIGAAGASRSEFVYRNVHQALFISAEILARLMHDKSRGTAVRAFILDGRWVARCPDCETGQECVDQNEPLFSCLNIHCLGIGNDHWPRPVSFPNVAQQRSLSEILLARPNPINRNWDRDGKVLGNPETFKMLEDENAAHGLPKRVAVTGG